MTRFEDWQWLDRDEMRARQFAVLQQRLQILAKTNEFHRARWADAGVAVKSITSFDDFVARMPRMTKRDVIADHQATPPFGTILGVDRAALVDIHLTSGTSGVGEGAFGLTESDAKLSSLGYTRFWQSAGIGAGDLIVLTHPVSFSCGGRLAIHAAAQAGVVAYYGFGVDKRVMLGVAQRMGVAGLFGTPGVLADLQRVAIEEGIDPRRDLPNLKALFIGLPAPPWVESIEALQDFWGVKVHENYGLTEALSVAVSCEQGVWDGACRYPMHFMEDLIVCEVLDPDTGMSVAEGGIGELTVTTLHREASPVVRYRTGDRVVHIPHHACPCGRAFDGIAPGKITRYDDMVKVKGATIWPATVDEIVLAQPEVDEYRVVLEVIDGREEMVLSVAFHEGIEATRRTVAAERIRDQVKVSTLVSPRVVEVPELDHYDFKARRWTDRRHTQAGV